tara:strand:- start:53 stop:601 length:549 start_codon:yes stop_codon:yes gene_type:complete
MNKFDFYYWPNVFSHNELLELHDIFNNTCDKNEVDEPAENVTKTSIVKISKWYNFKSRLSDLEQLILATNQQHFGYNLYHQYDINNLLLNEYDSKIKSEYDWHYDGGTDKFDIKFTTLINASIENYEGGEFNLFLNRPTHVDKLDNPGSVVMFKSHIYHKVNPVRAGKRHSITIFHKGPRFI